MRKNLLWSVPIIALVLLGAGCGESLGKKVDDQVDSAQATASDKIAQEAAERAMEKELEKNGQDGNVDVDDKSISITTGEGEFAIGENVALPSGFPSEIPIYNGSKISTASASSETKEYSASLNTEDTYEDVVSFYKDALNSNGWTLGDTNTADLNGSGFTHLEATGHDLSLNVTVTSGVSFGDGKIQILLATEAK
ncbi:MAG: hypothetical protein COW24_03165 [Candidatus Kerfeldbacteria bacterium CG15_BIG_FIL_POST_REV_8_21_14_020_45_12]|uniref:Lipoprotein n=1 Tax=Candidatus Kerfeldbacteria bacterium CG15_BIG_FIL_POST_REV_8_21_14_020_45_12 TaxID=2014247 RepID=A0A2M7H3X2_9BACT|nr:MAG: hypothetical protein COW24_03165 [Candidatus Kerfeldbacteria bacterium CG15_BIG_FIL_POST_REV_8_21_14_020_45_12]PJA92768.1 MAG: hypothetical protein CO132_06285 [Candidatus Kerfeldbacteria bacterium CG_4_9_14_3_um_filter_45_8]